MSDVLHWYDDICCPRCKGRVNSWDKRISRALKYKSIVCEKCIAKEYDMEPERLRHVMQTEMGLVPCPGL